MANLSNARKAGIALGVLAQQARRNRIVAGVVNVCRITGSHFARILHQLWLEVTGLVFLALAVIGVLAFVREYTKHQAGNGSLSRAGVAVCFTLLFGWFGVSSFWRVRKKRVSR